MESKKSRRRSLHGRLERLAMVIVVVCAVVASALLIFYVVRAR